VTYGSSGFTITYSYDLTTGTSAWYDASTYPSAAQVGDERGAITSGIQAGNVGPWCVKKPTDAALQASFDQLQTARGTNPLPLCPDAWLVDANKLDAAALDTWSLRAAANAGMAVFLYLDKLEHDATKGKGPQPSYDHCEQL
jgi:hypothetical protein